MARLDIAQLLLSLQKLFYRVSHLHLMTRMNAYQGGGGEIREISEPLNEHLETLVSQATAQGTGRTPETVNSATVDQGGSPVRAKQKRRAMQLLRGSMNGLSRLFTRQGSSVVIQPHLSDQLQRSVRQHLNTSLRKARTGDLANAKLYANLASNALRELVRYMPKEDFDRFNGQICADLKEFQGRDIYKPLAEFSD